MAGPEKTAATGERFGDETPAAAGSTHSKELQKMQIDDIKLPAEIEALRRDPVVHNGRRVMTTELLAVAYGTAAENIQMNFSRNADRFTEGVHFIKLTGADLRAFKNQPTHSGLVGARASHLILWLDRGAARHAKLIETDEAWEVFEKLEDAYFQMAAEGPTRDLVKPASSREIRLQMEQSLRLGAMCGFVGNQLMAAASRATRALTGFDFLKEMGVERQIAGVPNEILTAGELGARLAKPMGAQETNLWLTAHGYQVASRGRKGRIKYEATEKGLPYSEMHEVPLDAGRAPRQLMWRTSMIAVIDAEMGEAQHA